MTRLRITPKTTPDRHHRRMPGQGVTLGDLLGEKMKPTSLPEPEEWQAEHHWRHVWSDES